MKEKSGDSVRDVMTEHGVMPAFKEEEGATNKGKKAAPRSYRGKEIHFAFEPPEGTKSCQYLDFGPVRSISDFQPPEP